MEPQVPQHETLTEGPVGLGARYGRREAAARSRSRLGFESPALTGPANAPIRSVYRQPGVPSRSGRLKFVLPRTLAAPVDGCAGATMAGQRMAHSPPWSGVVVRISGEVDCSTVPAMAAALDRARRDGTGNLLVDLSETTCMDGAGLTVLLRARGQWNGNLAVYRPPRSLQRILQALDMQDAFTVVDPAEPMFGRLGG